MTLRLDSFVTCGELLNLSPNSVHGVLGMRDHDRPLHLQLTGNFQGELEGKHIRFEIREGATLPAAIEPPLDLARIAWDQVGPTGTMTLGPRAHDGQPSTDAKPVLFLEWFSQNGHVVLEIVDPIVEFVDPVAPPDEPDQGATGTVTWGPSETAPPSWEESSDESGLAEADNREDEPDDPYGLFPEDLETQFEEQAQATDEAILVQDQSEFVRQIEAYDEAVADGGVPIREIFDPPMRIYRADELDDERIAVEFRKLLARLVLHGIALDMCAHYTPRSAYKLLVERILVEERTYPALSPIGFVQHYMTHEYCPECDAEIEEKYDEYSLPSDEDGSAESESDMPF